ncbi:MAG: polysaccharide biosynthesis C-terminal domain-containing protein [Bacteroidales bacterium]|nr:polysaccharide biosynthesis C-terminal domain-containing protein [Bacteroidales bacterium]
MTYNSCFALFYNLIFYAEQFMQLLYKNDYSSAAEVYRILILCFIPIATTYIYGTFLTANNSLKLLNIVSAAGVLVNIVMNLILIPHFKSLGAAYASLLTQSITTVIQLFAAKKITKQKIDFKLLSFIILFVLTTIALNLIMLKTSLNWIVSVAIIFGLGFSLAFVLRLINLKDMYLLVKDKEGL